MKNLHILPTDKPSRLFIDIDDKKLKICVPLGGEHMMNQHIYITSDEEIKEGDWVFNFEYDYIVQYDSKKHDDKFWYKKIILTTDQDLIKDGVQPIDDEFLEWFVKNPSCESVKYYTVSSNTISTTITRYEIIIPKEELIQWFEQFKKKGGDK